MQHVFFLFEILFLRFKGKKIRIDEDEWCIYTKQILISLL